MRRRIFEVIEVSKEKDITSFIYDVVMTISIIISLCPLFFKELYNLFIITDVITMTIFIIDYLLRYITADYKINKGKFSFIIYPFTFWGIMDLLSIIPTITFLNNSFKLLKLFRIFKILRIFTFFKVFRYSKNINILSKVFEESKNTLIAVFTLSLVYILLSATIIFNVEPDSFNTFFDALYWATILLTTIGYGDIYPVSNIGKIVSMISSLCGIAIIALPSSIITSNYIKVLKEEK